ncbi:MAG: sulfatase-like hydrolase/transferase [Phaeodactylibacter sp.]|nr:sulfatase-like hydrolase/transferase [Phaeodactylibacter sp.]MCB9292577.1 sulfatase-like hydrolase/transferase [Lewinellaceae bacterium]
MKYLLPLLFIVLFCRCNTEDEPIDIDTPDTPNILLIIADDMGKDATPGFSEGSVKPSTPNLDNIKNQGLTFNNLWVSPTCSPTRASIITGKYGYRTGVKWANDELGQSERILQKYINEETNNAYATAIIGKWHLSGESTTINPESFGLDYYAGLIRGGVQDYYQWQLTEDGAGSLQTEYISKVFTDLSIDWVNSQSKPWFLWLAYNAPHTPFHVPPNEMHSQGSLPGYTDAADPTPYYMAAIEAMDFQIGRLLAGIPEEELINTVIIFLGDNGTPNQVAQSPYSRNTVKGTLYQGGINVPMFISGKGVSRTGEENSLICGTDLFCTIAELAGAGISEIHDSKSFKALLSSGSSHRAFQYSEMDDGTNDAWAISNGEYKLIVNANGNEEMYDLVNDPYENNDLLAAPLTDEEENAKAELEAELLNIRD